VEGSRTGVSLIAGIALVATLATALALDQCARRHVEVELTTHPPFVPPSAAERARALGSLEGVPAKLRAALTDENAFEPIPKPGISDWLTSQHERGQTFEAFVASHPNRPDAARRTLYLQPLGEFGGPDAPPLDILARFAGAFFALPVTALPPREVEGLGVTDRINRDTRVKQLLTSDLLRLLKERLPDDAFAVLGLTMQDLYPDPRWNFVFGQSSLQDRAGVYSFARYAPKSAANPGLDPSKLVLLRGANVLAHETGHMFGLLHCTYWRCLMNGSNHLGELDARPLHLCPVCLRKLQWSVGFDVEERYRRLRDTAKTAGFEDEARWLDERVRVVTAFR
jgi:archaemetzincin